MKITQPIPKRIALTLMLIATASNFGQRWETILDVEGASSRALAIDPSTPPGENWTRLIISGQIVGSEQSGIPNKIFRFQQSDPATPATPDIEPLHASGALVFSLTSHADGSLYFAGTLNPLNTGNKWIVRGSLDGGSTWSELLRWELAPGILAQARGLAFDAAGSLYACGLAGDASNFAHWIVLKSQNRDSNWSIVNDLKAASPGITAFAENTTEAKGIAFVSGIQDGLFVVGARDNIWTVMRSRDNGQSWTVVDSWTPKRGQITQALKIGTNSAGRIFVLGGLGNPDTPQWVVRMSENGGDSWQTAFGPWSSGTAQRPKDMAVDAFGNVWISGVVYSSTTSKGKMTWTSVPTVIRLEPLGSEAFSATRFSLPAQSIGSQTYSEAGVNALMSDDVGNIYVMGSYTADKGFTWRWFLQRFIP